MKKIIASPHAPKAVGPYSQAVETAGVLYVSGQLPIDAETGRMAEGIEAQTRVLRTEGACGFGVSAQVSLFVRQWRQERVQLVEDLYSTRADTAIRREPVRIAFERPLPPVEQETVQKLEFGCGQPLVYLTELECSPVSQAPEGDHNTLRTTVRMKLVYQDESGSPVSAERTAEVSAPMSAAPDWTQPSATPPTITAILSGTFLPQAM